MSAPASLPPRPQLPREQTWDIEALFPTPQDWEAEYAALPADIEPLRAYTGRLGESPETLLRFLSEQQAVTLRLQRLGQYASMAASVDGTDAEAAARRERVSALSGQLAAATAFARPELLALPREQLEGWLTRPGLSDYARTFQKLWQEAQHVRDPEVEELLGLLNAPFASARGIHPTLVNMDLDLGTAGGIRIGHGNIAALEASPDRELRRQAWEAYADAHLSMRHTQAAALSTGVRQDVFLARARRYPDSLSAALAPSELPTEVFHTLIETYRRHLPTWHRYWAVRARALGLEKLREYDVKAPLTESPPAVTYAQAVDWIAEGMAPLGSEYVDTLRAGLTSERWVDWGANEGKRQGAYSTGLPGGKSYIFMSWNDSLFSLSTLAHEIGHSLHSTLSNRAQPVPNARYTLFAAEVASNFNQALVRRHLFATQPDRNFQIALIEEAMSNFHRYFFIMPTLARFELETHQRAEAGRSLSAPDLIRLMADLLAEGYGEGVEMDPERSGIMWAEFSTHLYSNFYTWQYATGISAAHALAGRFERDPQGAQADYLAFLRAGGSLPPLEALRRAGVDLRTPQAVEETFGVLAGYVEQLDGLIGA